MRHFYQFIIRFRYVIMALFFGAAVFCAYCYPKIIVNYDMNDYLPEDTASTVSITTMEEEFEGAIPNARVMLKNVSPKEARRIIKKIEEIPGIISVSWLNDLVPEGMPLDMLPKSMLDSQYKKGNALFNVAVDEDLEMEAIPRLYELIGEENAMTGTAIDTVTATLLTVSEVPRVAVFSVLFLIFILTLTTTSWLEPYVVMAGLGVAILINAGSNLIFREISFVTNAAGSILQLAVSLDYSVFLIHRFEECRAKLPPVEAMVEALVLSTTSILSSGLTTVIGFLALVMMRFQIGPDLGLALAKGVGISLITVFIFMPGVILSVYPLMDKTTHRSFLPDFHGIGRLIRRICIPLAIVFVCLAAPAYITSNSNSYYFGSSHIFGPGTRPWSDQEQIEEIFGKNDTYVLMVPKGSKKNERSMLEELEKLPQIQSTTSLVGILTPSIPAKLLPNSILKQLQSENYDRIVLSISADYEGEETFNLVRQIREIAGKYYPEKYWLAGEGVSIYDLMVTVTSDMLKVNLLAIGAVFLVLLFTMRDFILPVILVLTIETAIWINLSIPAIAGTPIFYIAYLIISSVQLGATVDYAILFTDRYRENRIHKQLMPDQAVVETVSDTIASILTSGIALTVVGFLLGFLSTHGVISQLGMLVGRGTICSLCAVFLVLPGFLRILDRFFVRT